MLTWFDETNETAVLAHYVYTEQGLDRVIATSANWYRDNPDFRQMMERLTQFAFPGVPYIPEGQPRNDRVVLLCPRPYLGLTRKQPGDPWYVESLFRRATPARARVLRQYGLDTDLYNTRMAPLRRLRMVCDTDGRLINVDLAAR